MNKCNSFLCLTPYGEPRFPTSYSFAYLFFGLPSRVMVHVVAQCHEEGLEHYLRSYVKVRSSFKLIFKLRAAVPIDFLSPSSLPLLVCV